MNKNTSKDLAITENISDIDVSEEMKTSFLEYAYSVIYSRALPDARDGLKPVQRRILFMMDEMGLSHTKGHVKSARVVGEVMGKLHPHGDTAIYDALVRQAQDFTLRLPLVDGHGNFGSLDDGPAASRYTEARMAAAAQAMTESLNEDVVDFVPNYDNQIMQPEVLPAAFPNLLVNGSSGIAVGMATNMAPHNLVEVIAAAQFLLQKPNANLEELMQYVPGPDFPQGGVIVGLDGIKDAYETGRGSFKTRARLTIEHVSPRRTGVIITELPYMVGPEKVIEKIRDAVNSKKLEGIADVSDYTDRKNGLRLIITFKNGYDPKAILERLYRFTPLEESFSINNVALVKGQPRTLGLKEMLEVYLEHRFEVILRRSNFRLNKRRDRLHLLEGLLIAVMDIDEVIQVIRSSDEAEDARIRLMEIFDLSQLQADYILELRLRRLTKFSQLELQTEKDQLLKEIAELEELISTDDNIREQISIELGETSDKYGTPRRTMLTSEAIIPTATARSTAKTKVTIADDPCTVILGSSDKIVRVQGVTDLVLPTRRSNNDGINLAIATTNKGLLGAVTNRGRLIRFTPSEIPEVPNNSILLSAGVKLSAYLGLDSNERVLTIVQEGVVSPIAMATKNGVIKRWTTEDWTKADDFPVITLKDDDEVISACPALDSAEMVFITQKAQLLRFSADLVRAQGRTGGGIAGIKLAADDTVLSFSSILLSEADRVLTVSGSSSQLAGVEPGRIKLSALDEYPAKGRGTGGVRCHAFLKGEDQLQLAFAGPTPLLAMDAQGAPLDIDLELSRRDASGTPASFLIDRVGTDLESKLPVQAE